MVKNPKAHLLKPTMTAFWFNARAKLHNVKVNAEAASVGMVHAWKFPEMF